MSNIQKVLIVLVEDDPGHARLIEKNLRRANIDNELLWFQHGQKALHYLFCQGEYAGCERPSPMLVLLDLNLPGLDGFQILQRLKADEQTQRIPIIVLTTTDNPHEIDRCYELGCNLYITKPVEYQQFCQVIRQTGFFLSLVTIPNGES